jgi:hypothetical protein
MRIAIVISHRQVHQLSTAEALQTGMRLHGDEADIIEGGINSEEAKQYDAVGTWGWRRGESYRMSGMNVLIMERAYIADRFTWVSLGWNGLNGRAKFPVNTNPSRWEKFHQHLMSPLWVNRKGYALLMGQVPSDTACRGVHIPTFMEQQCRILINRGWTVKFRQHPRSPFFQVPQAEHLPTTNTISQDLLGASLVVTYNSNSAVDAVLAGIPTIAYDAGSMAWDVTGHSVESGPVMPDRSDWAHRIAWKQWLPEEITNGIAWPYVKGALNAS